MEIKTISHKGLKKLLLKNDASGLGGEKSLLCRKIRNILFYLCEIETEEELFIPVLKWKAHFLEGNRKNEMSLFVTGNYRLTFSISEKKEILDLNLEDYH